MVGASKTVFTIHAATLQPLSRYFKTIINSSSRESKEGLECPDVDVETFFAFSQFAYDRDYPPPNLPPYTAVARTAKEARRGQEGQRINKFARSRMSRCSLLSWHYSACKNSRQEGGATRQERPWRIREAFIASSVARTRGIREDSTRPEALLPHAKLYVLGCRYDIPSLRVLAYRKIALILIHMLLSYHTADCVAELVEYVYANTATINDAPNKDELRKLLVVFAACVYEHFLTNPRFSAAVRAHGEFGLGILDMLQTWTL